MGRFTFSLPSVGTWPKRRPAGPKRHRTCSLSPGAATTALCAIGLWNVALLAMAILVVAAPGNGPSHFNFEKVWIGTSERVRMAFLWCLIPTLVTLVSIIDILSRKSLAARRMTFSAAFSTTLYGAAFFLWGSCTYYGLSDICWTGSWTSDYLRGNPSMLRYILPWCALGSAIVYFVVMFLAIVDLRRQRGQAVPAEAYQKSLIQEGRPSFDSSEFAVSSIGDQTLPSRPRSTVPSRQLSKYSKLSMTTRSERPPTYYSNGDDSLLTVDEKDQTRGSFGYV